ncbi:hypothetical protein [Sporisorium scitamineum]|uniref:Uncharacterized protein n=1 Tax=Sporisorium scitamineum TaxID=49012 RepID=A0A0F7S9I8_9BASI|nr:hypothetical protein [Sporisorium scitamineum]
MVSTPTNAYIPPTTISFLVLHATSAHTTLFCLVLRKRRPLFCADLEQVQRYLAVDEAKYALLFPKRDLLRVLGAVFPLNIKATLRLPGNERLRAKELRFPKIRLSLLLEAWDRDIFKWHTLKEGYLPEGFCDRIAEADARKASRTTQCPLQKPTRH